MTNHLANLKNKIESFATKHGKPAPTKTKGSTVSKSITNHKESSDKSKQNDHYEGTKPKHQESYSDNKSSQYNNYYGDTQPKHEESSDKQYEYYEDTKPKHQGFSDNTPKQYKHNNGDTESLDIDASLHLSETYNFNQYLSYLLWFLVL